MRSFWLGPESSTNHSGPAMASYQVHLRPIANWDAKPLPPLPLDPGRSHRHYSPRPDNKPEKSRVALHRRGNVFPPELDIGKFQGADSRPVEKSMRTRPNHQSSPSTASAPDNCMSKKREEDTVPGGLRHARQKSDQPTTRSARSKPTPPPITTVEDLSLPPKVRQIIGVDSPRKARTAQWNPISTQAAPGPVAAARPISTASAYSQASGPKREMDMLFHMEEIVEEREKIEDEDEIRQRLESLIHSPGFAAIGCFPDGPASDPRFSLSASTTRGDEPRQRIPTNHHEQPPQDHRSSQEMYHDLVVELAQSAPAALPPPPKPPTELDGRPSESSSLHHRRHHSSLSRETGQLHRGNAHASCPQLSRTPPKSISVFDHESSDSESDSDSRPLWSPKFAFLGRRPLSKPSKRR